MGRFAFILCLGCAPTPRDIPLEILETDVSLEGCYPILASRDCGLENVCYQVYCTGFVFQCLPNESGFAWVHGVDTACTLDGGEQDRG
jgi:hypothetical protein